MFFESSLGTDTLDLSQGYITQTKASQAHSLHESHVTRVGGLCELHLNLAKWKQTKHIVCVRMKASLRRAVTEGLMRGCGLSSSTGELKSTLNDLVSMGLSYVCEQKSYSKTSLHGTIFTSFLALSRWTLSHKSHRHMGLSLYWFSPSLICESQAEEMEVRGVKCKSNPFSLRVFLLLKTEAE